MEYLSGSPLYNYELARELKRLGHNVCIVSSFEHPFGGGEILQKNLLKFGIGCLPKEYLNQAVGFDLIIGSQMSNVTFNCGCPIINVVHSEYDCENP